MSRLRQVHWDASYLNFAEHIESQTSNYMLCLDETALTISKHFRGEPNANSVPIGQFSVLKTNRKYGLREITLPLNCHIKSMVWFLYSQKQLIIYYYHWKHNKIAESFLLKLKWKEEKLPNQLPHFGEHK